MFLELILEFNMQLLSTNLQNSFYGSNTGAQTLAESPGSLISNLVPNVMIAAGVVFMFIILYSGFGIISNSGGSNSQSLTKFKQTLLYAVIGFLIVVSAYFILQIVSVSLTGGNAILTDPIIP